MRPGTPPISHVELTSHLGDLHYEGVPLAVAAALESEARLDKYIEAQLDEYIPSEAGLERESPGWRTLSTRKSS